MISSTSPLLDHRPYGPVSRLARFATTRRPQRGLTSPHRRRPGAPRPGSQHLDRSLEPLSTSGLRPRRLDGKSTAALAAAVAFKRCVASHGNGVLAGLPIAYPHLAELFADYQKKVMDKAVKVMHDPPPAMSVKPAASSDDDDIDSLHAQLEKPSPVPRPSKTNLSMRVASTTVPRTPRTRTQNVPLPPRRTTRPSHPPSPRRLTLTLALDLWCLSPF